MKANDDRKFHTLRQRAKSTLRPLLLLVNISYIMILFLGCTTAHVQGEKSVNYNDPFNFGIAKPNPEVQSIIDHASKDFNLVLEGKDPIFSIMDQEQGVAADGGSTIYKGNGYSLKIVCSIATIGGIDGYFFGPIINFTSNKILSNAQGISHVNFFSRAELARLRACGQGL